MKKFWMLCFIGALAVETRAALTNELDAATDTRHGLFNGLDSRSQYGQGAFPEPFLVDDSDLESGEARLDWLHTRAGSAKSDAGKAEVEKAFGIVTFELEVPYEYDTAPGQEIHGFDNVDLGARCPFWQYVSQSGFIDSTLGAGIEVGIPTGSEVSKNAELVPKIFDDLKLGDFTAQVIVGDSTLFGPGEEGGLQTFEYGCLFGYNISRRQLPLPDVLETIPFFELIGETGLNKGDAGHNSLLGNAGFRFNLKSIGPVQPRPGVGFVFPMDSAAREGAHWGVMTSLVFEF